MLKTSLRRFHKFAHIVRFLTRRKKQRRNMGPVVFFGLRKNPYGRYLYCFVKMLTLAGWRVYFPRSVSLIIDLASDKYAVMILEDDLVFIGRPTGIAAERVKWINEEQLSLDYFSFLCPVEKSISFAHVPMPQHPLMYRLGYWDSTIGDQERINGVFFAGNLDPEEYVKIESENVFPVLSRVAFLERMTRPSFYLKNFDDLHRVLEQNEGSNRLILVDSRRFMIPPSELRQVLSRFEFFLALPGVFMPFSHNVVEAMSAGSIPFIQEYYAGLFRPPLSPGVNCMTFVGSDDVEERYAALFRLTTEDRRRLRRGVLDYYERFLTPRAVSQLVERLKPGETLYLQASGGGSVKVLGRNQETISSASVV